MEASSIWSGVGIGLGVVAESSSGFRPPATLTAARVAAYQADDMSDPTLLLLLLPIIVIESG